MMAVKSLNYPGHSYPNKISASTDLILITGTWIMMAQLAVSRFLSTYSRIAHMERNNFDFKLLVYLLMITVIIVKRADQYRSKAV